jgi:DNA ligase (NAD+)
MKDNKETLAALEAKIRHHQRLYYDLSTPEISDQAFDALWDELKKLEPNSPVLNERSQFDADYKHEFPMGSLEKCKTVDEIIKRFTKNVRKAGKNAVISAKLDGSSLSVHYNDGRFVRAVTRGRTESGKGKIVSANALMIPSIPKTIPFTDKCEVRGECVILVKDFEAINATRSEKFSNPRNAASGAISGQDPNECLSRKITFVACKTIFTVPVDSDYLDCQCFKELETWGFIVPKHIEVDVTNLEELNKAIDQWKIERAELPYWNDGIVIRVKDNEIYNTMGISGVCPNGACAFKFENETSTTIITDIEWNTGRLGFVSPVAIFQPVDLGGAVITRCTLNNPTWMKEHGGPSIGSKVLIAKMNDIIPGVQEVIEGGFGKTNQPKNCPTCHSELAFAETGDGEGAKLLCSNPNCQARTLGTVLNMLRKFEVKGIADSTLEKMFESGVIVKVWDIFSVKVEDLVQVGFGKKESTNIVESLKNLVIKPSNILAAVGLEMWGRRMFDLLQKNSADFTDERLLAGDFPYDELIKVKGIGPEKAEALSKAFASDGFGKKFLSELLKYVKPTQKAVTTGGSLSGKSFCLSGSMPRGKKQIEQDITAAGGSVKDGVSKDLSYLVAGEGSGSKSEKAAKYNVPIITEDELYKILGI